MSASAKPANVLPLYLTGFAAFVGLYLPQPILPLLADEFAVSPGDAGLIISLTVLGIGLAAPFIGVLSDRFGRRRILVGAASVLSLLMLGCAASGIFSGLLTLRFLQGVALPGLFVVGLAYTAERLDAAAMRRAAGIYVAWTVIGGLAGRLLAGALTDFASWRAGFLISSLFYATLVIVWWRQQDMPVAAGRDLRTTLNGTLSHLQNQALLGGLLIGFCLFLAFQSTFTYLPFKLTAAPYTLSATFTSLAYVSFVAGMVSSGLAGNIRARLGLRPSFVLGFALAGLGNLFTLSAPLTVIALGLLIVCFGNWLVQGLAVGFVATATENDRAGANALYQLFYYVGGSLGGYLPGLGYGQLGYGGAVGLSLLFIALGFACTALLAQEDSSLG